MTGTTQSGAYHAARKDTTAGFRNTGCSMQSLESAFMPFAVKLCQTEFSQASCSFNALRDVGLIKKLLASVLVLKATFLPLASRNSVFLAPIAPSAYAWRARAIQRWCSLFRSASSDGPDLSKAAVYACSAASAALLHSASATPCRAMG